LNDHVEFAITSARHNIYIDFVIKKKHVHWFIRDLLKFDVLIIKKKIQTLPLLGFNFTCPSSSCMLPLTWLVYMEENSYGLLWRVYQFVHLPKA